jgi:hypothetical protein
MQQNQNQQATTETTHINKATNVINNNITYQWESFSKTWENVRETRSGRLTVVESAEQRSSNSSERKSHHSRGLQRSVCIIVDNSACMVDRLHLLEYSEPHPSPPSTGFLVINFIQRLRLINMLLIVWMIMF